MSDEPIDLSDEALFAGLEPEVLEPLATPEQATAAVRTALRVMQAAGLRPVFGMDLEDAERLWPVKLAGCSSTAIIQAANVWIEAEERELPLLTEFETLARHQQAIIDHPVREREPGQGCPECGDTADDPTDGWVVVEREEPGTPRTVRPCEECTPDRHAAWRRHFPRKAKAGARR